MQTVGIIGTVGENLVCRDASDQIAGRGHVVLLAGPENEADRQTESIDYGMDFGAEPTPGAPESLGFSAPLFTRAPPAWA